MDDDFDDLAGDELDFEERTQDEGDALSLLLAANAVEEGAAVWD